MIIKETVVVSNLPKGIELLGKVSTLTLSKKSSPGDGSYGNGVKGGGRSTWLRPRWDIV